MRKPAFSQYDHLCARGWDEATDQETTRLGKCVLLSGGVLALCEALLRGEHVPVDQLDPFAVRGYGRRP